MDIDNLPAIRATQDKGQDNVAAVKVCHNAIRAPQMKVNLCLVISWQVLSMAYAVVYRGDGVLQMLLRACAV